MISKFISDFLISENIKYFSSADIRDCIILNQKKLPEYTESVVFFLIPYYVKDAESRNISVYAVPCDYHLYIKELSESFEHRRIASGLDFQYRFFADNSPFCERTCAEKCNLGKIGKNGLLANPEYGSFVFIGSICVSSDISIPQTTENFKSDICGNCEKCKTFCPMEKGKCPECLSAITQKKKITDTEAEIISQAPIKWGCDICQLICPYNKDIPETPIKFFRQNRIPKLTKEILSEMSEEDFAKRAYSWRGRDVINRNLDL